jgi:hypothetical protein
VIDIGRVPTPMSYFAAHELGTASCVSVTGSHNPPEYNGLKMVLGGQTLYGDMIQDLRRRIANADFCDGRGVVRHASIRQAYLDRIVGDVKLARPMKIVIDCGNGVAGSVAPELFRRMGCTVTPLYCEVDGNFPNHHPDPSKPENLEDLQRALRETNAELGLAFDGDGDRLGVVTKDGEIIYPDRQLMLFAADILARNPGAQIIYDVKCSRWVAESVRFQGGEAADVEHRPRPDQDQAEGNRRALRRRDERPHVLQGALVRFRRRTVCRRPPAGNRVALARCRLAAEAPAQRDLHARNSTSRCRKASRMRWWQNCARVERSCCPAPSAWC